MPESVEFTVDAPVSPVRVLVGNSECEPPEMRVDGRPTSRLVRWLGPMSGDLLSMPAQHGFWFDDQKRVAMTYPTYCRPEEGKDRPVGVGELWSIDLAL